MAHILNLQILRIHKRKLQWIVINWLSAAWKLEHYYHTQNSGCKVGSVQSQDIFEVQLLVQASRKRDELLQDEDTKRANLTYRPTASTSAHKNIPPVPSYIGAKDLSVTTFPLVHSFTMWCIFSGSFSHTALPGYSYTECSVHNDETADWWHKKCPFKKDVFLFIELSTRLVESIALKSLFWQSLLQKQHQNFSLLQ